MGLEGDFADRERFTEFCDKLYDYIKQIKRQMDLHNKEKGKIDRLTMRFKVLERKIGDLQAKIEELEKKSS